MRVEVVRNASMASVGAHCSAARSRTNILKENSARGTYIYLPAGSMRLITNTFTYCSPEVPQWSTVSISGYHIRDAGSYAVQEAASRPPSPPGSPSSHPRLSFFFNLRTLGITK